MTPIAGSRYRLGAVAGVLGIAAILSGCNIAAPAQDDPTHYYVLSQPPAEAKAPQGSLRVGLRTVGLEGYLKHREIVVRTGPNEVEFKDYRRWAESLDAAIGRSLRSGLLLAPSVSQVYAEPFPLDQQRDCDVCVEILRCEGEHNGLGRFAASLVATIEVTTPGPNPKILSRTVFRAPSEAWDGADFDALAGLISKDVAALGRAVAEQLPARN